MFSVHLEFEYSNVEISILFKNELVVYLENHENDWQSKVLEMGQNSKILGFKMPLYECHQSGLIQVISQTVL